MGSAGALPLDEEMGHPKQPSRGGSTRDCETRFGSALIAYLAAGVPDCVPKEVLTRRDARIEKVFHPVFGLSESCAF